MPSLLVLLSSQVIVDHYNTSWFRFKPFLVFLDVGWVSKVVWDYDSASRCWCELFMSADYSPSTRRLVNSRFFGPEMNCNLLFLTAYAVLFINALSISINQQFCLDLIFILWAVSCIFVWLNHHKVSLLVGSSTSYFWSTDRVGFWPKMLQKSASIACIIQRFPFFWDIELNPLRFSFKEVFGVQPRNWSGVIRCHHLRLEFCNQHNLVIVVWHFSDLERGVKWICQESTEKMHRPHLKHMSTLGKAAAQVSPGAVFVRNHSSSVSLRRSVRVRDNSPQRHFIKTICRDISNSCFPRTMILSESFSLVLNKTIDWYSFGIGKCRLVRYKTVRDTNRQTTDLNSWEVLCS